MAQKSPILTISKVIDDDSGLYSVGEIDGAFDQQTLLQYLREHGEYGRNQLLSHFAFLQYQVIDASRAINSEAVKAFAAGSK